MACGNRLLTITTTQKMCAGSAHIFCICCSFHHNFSSLFHWSYSRWLRLPLSRLGIARIHSAILSLLHQFAPRIIKQVCFHSVWRRSDNKNESFCTFILYCARFALTFAHCVHRSYSRWLRLPPPCKAKWKQVSLLLLLRSSVRKNPNEIWFFARFIVTLAHFFTEVTHARQ